MPSVTHTSQAALPPDDFWDLIMTVEHWADLIPGYVRHVELSSDESIWTVRGDVGILTRQVELRVLVTQRVPPQLVEFSIEGITEQMAGHGVFRIAPGQAQAGAAVPARLGRASSIRKRWISWLLRRLFRSRTMSPSPVPTTPAAIGDWSDFSFELELDATGVTGPVVNRLIAPLLPSAAEHLADGIAERASVFVSRKAGVMPLTALGKEDQP